MILLSGSRGHKWTKRARYFFGGLVLVVLSTFVVYASSVYNQRIATSDTELIINVVAILFLSDLDEMAYSGVMAFNPHWAPEDYDKQDTEIQRTDVRVDQLTQENLAMKKENSAMKEELVQVKSRVESLCDRIESIESKTIPWDTRLFVSTDLGIC